MVYVKKNMNESAIQVLNNLVKKFPEDPEFHYHFAMALLQKGDKQRARVELEQALSKKPPKSVADKIKEAIARAG